MTILRLKVSEVLEASVNLLCISFSVVYHKMNKTKVDF